MPVWLIPILASMASSAVSSAAQPKTSSSSPAGGLGMGQAAPTPQQSEHPSLRPEDNPNFFLPSPYSQQDYLKQLQSMGFA